MQSLIEGLTNYIRSGALVLALVIILFIKDRSKFINVNILAKFGFGIAFGFFPKYMLGFQVAKELDDTAILCSGLFGMSLIAAILVSVFTRDTRDGTVPITIMTAEVFSSSVILLLQIHTHFLKDYKTTNPWSDQHAMFGMVGSGVLLLSNLFYLLRSHDFTGYPQHNIRINEFLRVDAWLSMLLALVFLAMPDIVFKHFWKDGKINSVSSHLVRCAGAMVLNTAFVSLQAAGFLHEGDKKKQFIGRLLGLLLLFVPFIQAAVLYGTFSLQQMEWSLLAVLPLAINGVLGYLAEGTIVSANKSQ